VLSNHVPCLCPQSAVITWHCIWQVERIDHGIRSIEDPELLEYLRKTQLPLTLCPFSNIKVRMLPAAACL
jgi:adenosine deaminase